MSNLLSSDTHEHKEFSCWSCVDSATWREQGNTVVQSMRQVLDEDAFRHGYLLQEPVVAQVHVGGTQCGKDAHIWQRRCRTRGQTQGTLARCRSGWTRRCIPTS